MGHCRTSESLRGRCVAWNRSPDRPPQLNTERNMDSVFETTPAAPAIPIIFVTKATWNAISADLPAQARQFANSNRFSAKPGACLTLPAANGEIAHVLFGLDNENGKFRDPFRPGQLPGLLP